MKRVVDKILSPQLFLLCYLPWLAINMVTVVNILSFTRVVLVLFAAWAVAICVKEYLFGGKQAWVHKGIAVLLFFLAACLMSKVLLYRYGGLDVIGKLCYFSLCILVLYPQRRLQSADYIKMLSVLARTLGIVIGIMMLISDWMFVSVFSSTITIRAGGTANVGFAENRLYGIFTSPNVGGAYALILVWCSFVTLLWSGKMRAKILWRILAAVQMILAVMYISVALSRGTYLMGLAMVIGYMILRPSFAREKALKAWLQVSLRVVSVVAAIFLSIGIVNVFNRVSCEIMTWNYETNLKSDDAEKDEQMQAIVENALLGSAGRVEADRDDIDITNKRTRIWKSNLSLLKGKHLLIGVNQPHEYLKKTMEQGVTYPEQVVTFVNYAKSNTHNGYLQILVSGGLLAFLPMAAFLAWCAYLAVRYMAKSLLGGKWPMNTAAYALFSVTLPMVLGVLVDNVVESNFALMGANFIQAFFWVVAGACVLSMCEGAKE